MTHQARNRHGFFNRFAHGWVIEEFLKTYLKNKCSYARKVRCLEDNTNQEQHQEELSDEEDPTDEEIDHDKNFDDDNIPNDEETDQIDADHEWHRGNGWNNQEDQAADIYT